MSSKNILVIERPTKSYTSGARTFTVLQEVSLSVEQEADRPWNARLPGLSQRMPPAPRERPLLVYDGECRLCSGLVERRREQAPEVDFVPGSALDRERVPIAPELLERTAVWVEPDGSLRTGAEAVFLLLGASGHRWPLWLYRHVPLFAPVSEWAYRLVAAHRHRLGGRRGD